MAESPVGSASELEVIQRYYDFVLRLVPEVGKFPRNHRFTLGQKIEMVMYDAADEFIAAKYASGARKADLLRQLNVRLERLRFLLRLSHDLKALSYLSYDRFVKDLLGVGQRVGSWLKWVEGGRKP